MPLTKFWPGLATNKTAGGDKQLNIPIWALCWKSDNNYELAKQFLYLLFTYLYFLTLKMPDKNLKCVLKIQFKHVKFLILKLQY